MSSEEKTKIEFEVEKTPILQELDAVTLMKEAAKYGVKEKFYKKKKDEKRGELAEILKSIHADRITFKDDKDRTWITDYYAGGPGEKLDQDLLKTNLMKIGKLPAPVVEKIFKASMVPTESESYAKVIPPREPKVKGEKKK